MDKLHGSTIVPPVEHTISWQISLFGIKYQLDQSLLFSLMFSRLSIDGFLSELSFLHSHLVWKTQYLHVVQTYSVKKSNPEIFSTILLHSCGCDHEVKKDSSGQVLLAIFIKISLCIFEPNLWNITPFQRVCCD